MRWLLSVSASCLIVSAFSAAAQVAPIIDTHVHVDGQVRVVVAAHG
jgi:hypothetical protein